ncbi:hypothetical protein Scep_028460 [Stephania cephalantha]|uniref:Uncharacterized protein n=1 Tax=Stephania cephalantha TaxID=152367 RepID=A0AAP0EHB5_9MAGN
MAAPGRKRRRRWRGSEELLTRTYSIAARRSSGSRTSASGDGDVDNSGRPASATVDEATPTMLGVVMFAHKGGRKNKKTYLGL